MTITHWRQVGKVDFYGSPYFIYLSNDEKRWGFSAAYSRWSATKPDIIYKVGYFVGVNPEFGKLAEAVLEAALLDADPSISPNAVFQKPKAKSA